jgi:hypothetical protein
MAEALRPLLPRVRLRVGVTGHRPGPKLPPDSAAPIRQTVDRIIAAIATSASNVIDAGDGKLFDRTLDLTVVSPLAEGADRIVAEAGLAAGFGLDAVLPFARNEYARDFADEAERAAFESLITRASSVFELDGDREQVERAYEAAGLVTLANCDLLIAIWDQNEAAGIGGTALIVERAVNEQIPVVLINPVEPAQARLLWAGDIALTPVSVRMEDVPLREALAHMDEVVQILIAPPQAGPQREELAAYMDERERRRNVGPWYYLLLRVFGGRPLHSSDFQLPPFLAASRAQWADYLKIVQRDDRLATSIDQILLPAFAAADNLSIHYARAYRSAYVFNFIAAALVATLAVFGLYLHYSGAHLLLFITEIFELLLTSVVILWWWLGHKRQWHRRWIEYRRIAECLRHMRLIGLTASVGPIARPGKSPDADWGDWYARAIRRLLPLPHQKVDRGYIEMIKAAIREAELRRQIAYHQDNATLMKRIDHRLHALGQILFVATAVTLLILLLMPQEPWLAGAKSFLIALTIVLPIFGSAFSAIRVQSEFSTVARRSQQTATRLTAIMTALEGETLTFARLADRVETASDMMMDDLMEWQLMFRTRPLSLPV